MTTNQADSDPFSQHPGSTLEDALREAGRDSSFTVEDLAASNPGFESDEEIDEFITAVRGRRNASLA
ncbi:MAG TPA: hypothetical protein VGX23_35760 [Actinocrinis sp.]|nr:hypothetical protein [Actinocrinis sp.]